MWITSARHKCRGIWEFKFLGFIYPGEPIWLSQGPLFAPSVPAWNRACRGCDLNIPYDESLTSDPGPDFQHGLPSVCRRWATSNRVGEILWLPHWTLAWCPAHTSSFIFIFQLFLLPDTTAQCHSPSLIIATTSLKGLRWCANGGSLFHLSHPDSSSRESVSN